MFRILVSMGCLAVGLSAGCGAPAGPSDGGSDEATDAGEVGGQDAGEQVSTPPNALADGTWNLSGSAATNCGVTFLSGMTGESVASSTLDFTLTNKANFNGMPMVLHCRFGDDSQFTCDDYMVGMTFSGCVANGGLRSISGHLAASGVDIEGSAWSVGQGTCPPNATCGPRDVSASGTVTVPAPAP